MGIYSLEYIKEQQEDAEFLQLLEKSSYSDSMTPQMAKSWYKKFVRQCRKGISDERDLDERIRILEDCLKDMKDDYNNKYGSGDRIKYVFKNMIPFNSIVRFIRNRDSVAGWAYLADILTMGWGGVIVRASLYQDMLDEQMEYTKQAIDYLKEKKKEFR